MSLAAWVIGKREYLARVQATGFWIATLTLPALLFAAVAVPMLMAEKATTSGGPILLVDRVGGVYPFVQASLDALRYRSVLSLQLAAPTGAGAVDTTALDDMVKAGKIEGYTVITNAALAGEQPIPYFTHEAAIPILGRYLEAALQDAATRYRLKQIGLGAAEIEAATRRISLSVKHPGGGPSAGGIGRQSSGRAGRLLAIGVVLANFVSMVIYGTHIQRGVLEEKANRIVEVIVSSVRPTDLMLGKIAGIGAAGLTQMCLWAFISLLIVTVWGGGLGLAAAGSVLGGVRSILLFLPLYFVLGYALSATLFAIIGAMFSTEEDAEQLATVISLIIAIPLLFMVSVLAHPSGMFATVVSLIPLFSPTLMLLRVATGSPPAWQIAASIVLPCLTVLALWRSAAKIYRVGIFMYGKPPTLSEVMRWARMS